MDNHVNRFCLIHICMSWNFPSIIKENKIRVLAFYHIWWHTFDSGHQERTMFHTFCLGEIFLDMSNISNKSKISYLTFLRQQYYLRQQLLENVCIHFKPMFSHILSNVRLNLHQFWFLVFNSYNKLNSLKEKNCIVYE